MSVENDDAGDMRSGQFLGQKVNDENSGSDEKDLARGVEGMAVGDGEIGGDFGGDMVG